MRAFNQPLEQSRGTADSTPRRVAVLAPCYNEEAAIAQVVEQFHKALPDAVIYVYDNNSNDGTAAAARAAGAVVGARRLAFQRDRHHAARVHRHGFYLEDGRVGDFARFRFSRRLVFRHAVSGRDRRASFRVQR